MATAMPQLSKATDSQSIENVIMANGQAASDQSNMPASHDCDDEGCAVHRCHLGHCQIVPVINPVRLVFPPSLEFSYSTRDTSLTGVHPSTLERPPRV